MRFGLLGGAGIQVGRILGIPIKLDLSFFLVFGLLVFLIATQLEIIPESVDGLGGAERWIYAVAGGVVYFLSLLIHELAHSLMARRYGMEVSSITLFFFGGVSLIREDSRRPGQEFWIAIVGPLASLVLGVGMLLVAIFALPDATVLQRMVFVLGILNCFLAGFNMLPGFPLDGGRVVRSFVWRVTGSRHRATRASARLGQLLGAAMIIYGIGGLLTDSAIFDSGLNSVWVLLIGFLLLTQAAQGVKAADLERDLAGLRVGELMLQPPVARTADADLPIRILAPSRAQLNQQDVFIVAEGGTAIGIASAVQILLLDEERYQSDTLRDIMLEASQVQPLGPDAGADEALHRLQKERTFVLPVVERGRLLGVVGLEQILKALGQSPPPRLDPSAGA
ncbi:MAG: site-2 protease family protein [Chloroflexota bacterium]|nr:site-2 protease family protein [Chloroflexota bacterium]